MARNGAGTYERAVADYVYNTTIDQTTVNQEMDDIASALTGSLAKNGETVPTANLPMGTYRHTGVGNGSARTDYAALGQVQDGKANWVDGGGTADAITATYSPVITALVDGQLCYVRATAANATTTPTFSPNGLTARTIVKNGGVALAAGDIVGDGHELELRYDLTNTRWELLNPKTDLSGYQPLDAQLTTLAALANTDGNFIVGNGSAWVAESGATARASLGLPALLNQNHGSDGVTKVTATTTAGVDFNTHTSAGVYNFDATSSANAPVTGLIWIFLEVFRHFNLAAGSEYTVQIAHDMNAGTRPRSWTRRQVGGSWSAWVETTSGAQSLAADGYKMLPGGLILQWGAQTVAASTTSTYSFPLAFPNACIQFVAGTSIDGPVSANRNDSTGGVHISASQYQLRQGSASGGITIRWIAVGY